MRRGCVGGCGAGGGSGGRGPRGAAAACVIGALCAVCRKRGLEHSNAGKDHKSDSRMAGPRREQHCGTATGRLRRSLVGRNTLESSSRE